MQGYIKCTFADCFVNTISAFAYKYIYIILEHRSIKKVPLTKQLFFINIKGFLVNPVLILY